MSPVQLAFNEYFFDKQTKKTAYLIGVSFCRYCASKTDDRNSWYSSEIELLEIVKRLLAAEHGIGEKGERGSRLFQLRSKHIQDVLIGYGLGVPRDERRFPPICKDKKEADYNHGIYERYLDHFVRGMFDANISCGKDSIAICLNIGLLNDLYLVLWEYAGIRERKKIAYPLRISGHDIICIRDFLYRDWRYIEEHGLYLPSKKKRFDEVVVKSNQKRI